MIELDLSKNVLRNIDGLKYLINLRVLKLASNSISNLDALEKYEGDNKELPTLTQTQRAALLGVIGGPIYVALVEIFNIDLLGIGFWPGLVALVSGVITFFWQMKPENDPGDGSAI